MSAAETTIVRLLAARDAARAAGRLDVASRLACRAADVSRADLYGNRYDLSRALHRAEAALAAPDAMTGWGS